MCVAMPARIVSATGDEARVRIGGAELRASLVLVPGAAVGDWVLVHAGFAIERISAEEAAATSELLRELAREEGG